MKIYEMGYKIRYEFEEGKYICMSKTINELKPAYLVFDVIAEYEYLEE